MKGALQIFPLYLAAIAKMCTQVRAIGFHSIGMPRLGPENDDLLAHEPSTKQPAGAKLAGPAKHIPTIRIWIKIGTGTHG
jgi:hypothetical protein